MNTSHRHLLAWSLSALASWAQAGRPLSTDDTATADAGTCQVETWHQRAGHERALVLAPACGVVPGLELALDSTWPTPRDVVRQRAGLALKLAPAGWTWGGALGELSWGLKASGAWLQPAHARWQGAGATVLALASLKVSEQVSWHLNLGAGRDPASDTQASLLNLALVWTPQPAWLLFVEAQGNNRKAAFGGTLTTAGARWWLVKDQLGLDFTVGHESGAGGPTRYTVGLGWYGIGS